jgi:glycosyltransferase involved in cell wall biosynthesis
MSYEVGTLRVAHLVGGNLFGGVETILVTLARYRSAATDMVPLFVACYDGRLRQELARVGEPVHLLGEARVSRPFSVLRARQALKEFLRRERVDVVVCHGAWPHALFAGTVKRSGVPLVFYQHDVLTGKHWVERAARRHRPVAIVANSRYTARSTSSVFETPLPEVVYCPVPVSSLLAPEERRRVRQELGVSPDTAVILQTSRMEAWKGHRRHLRVLSKLTHRRDWVSLIAGGAQRPAERAYEAELRALSETLGLASRVKFLGHRSDVPRLLGAADLHFQPNESPEPFGIAFIEAMLAGLPVVTRPLGAVPEYIDPSVGRLAADDDGLARAIEQLLDSPEERRTLGQNARRSALDLCRPEQQVKALEALLCRAAFEKAQTGRLTDR